MIPILAGVIVLWLSTQSVQSDRLAIRDAIYSRFGGSGTDSQRIALTELPQWRSTANTNIVGWVLTIDEGWLAKRGVTYRTNGITQWKTGHMQNQNHLQVRRGDNPEAVLRAAGLEPMPTTGGTIP